MARWDFTNDELTARFKGTKPGGGLHFSLTWPDAAPATEDLLLFVRLTTSGGQQFVAEYALQPTSETNPAASWTEVESTSQHEAGPQLVMDAANGWQRAVAPLPPREEPIPPNAPAKEEKSTPDEVPSPAGASVDSEPVGPSWAPYR